MDLCRYYSNQIVGEADDALFASSGPAEPTSRVLDGSQDHGAAEEWAEPGTYGTHGAERIYLFRPDDLVDKDGVPLDIDNLPWDTSAVRIILDPA